MNHLEFEILSSNLTTNKQFSDGVEGHGYAQGDAEVRCDMMKVQNESPKAKNGIVCTQRFSGRVPCHERESIKRKVKEREGCFLQRKNVIVDIDDGGLSTVEKEARNKKWKAMEKTWRRRDIIKRKEKVANT